MIATMSPSVLFAQSATSRYVVTGINSTVTEMPDGTTVDESTYLQVGMTDAPDFPYYNDIIFECTGKAVAGADGALISSDGMCRGVSSEGDFASFWWRADEAGTDSCPTQCGTWGSVNGTGKYKDKEVSGTWKGVTATPAGSFGTATMTVK